MATQMSRHDAVPLSKATTLGMAIANLVMCTDMCIDMCIEIGWRVWWPTALGGSSVTAVILSTGMSANIH